MSGRAGPGGPDAAHRPARRRRVDAPPTNPEADRADDVADPPESDPPATRGSADPRDDWMAEQRPPHWD